MNACDYIRDCKKKLDNSSPTKSTPLNRLLHRNGSSHHKSHEVLSSASVTPTTTTKCDLRTTTKSIDRKDKNKRNSRSEDNLLGIVQKIVNPSPSGQILLSQDFFLAKAKDDGGDGEYAEKKSYLRNSKELLRLNQSSPSTTSTEDLNQIDGGGGRRFGKNSHEELNSPLDADYRSDEGRSQEEEDDETAVDRPRLDFSELKKKLVIDEKMMPPLQSPTGSTMTDSQGLIVPKKLINPCIMSIDRQNLHRELMFNNKVGRTVLNQKSELQRVLDKQKERQFAAAQQQQQQQQMSGGGRDSLSGELGRVIMQRAQRLENLQNSQPNQDEELKRINPEYVNARAKLKATAAAGGGGGSYDYK